MDNKKHLGSESQLNYIPNMDCHTARHKLPYGLPYGEAIIAIRIAIVLVLCISLYISLTKLVIVLVLQQELLISKTEKKYIPKDKKIFEKEKRNKRQHIEIDNKNINKC